MGKMKIIEEVHQDPTTNDKRWLSVTFEPTETFGNPVSLNQIKTFVELKNSALVKQPRLAFSQLTKEEFQKIILLQNES